jgi:hypothetical protein
MPTGGGRSVKLRSRETRRRDGGHFGHDRPGVLRQIIRMQVAALAASIAVLCVLAGLAIEGTSWDHPKRTSLSTDVRREFPAKT